LELYDCPPEVLDDRAHIERAISEAVDHANATLLHQVSRRFVPQGVTALALLAESHISIHTWPELGYAAADIFTCGDKAMPQKAADYLVKALRSGRHSVKQVERGVGVSQGAAPTRVKPAVAATA
jgi:S-adenosylmethionine decarboxylase